MVKGYILDVYPDYNKNTIVTWIASNGKTKRIEDIFEPSIYVYSNELKLIKLANTIKNLPQVKQIELTYRKIKLGSDEKSIVLKVKPKKLHFLSGFANRIDAWGKFHNYELFNVDIRLSTRYLERKGLFCNALVQYNNNKFTSNDKKWALDYTPPSFSSVKIQIKKNNKEKREYLADKIDLFSIDDYIIKEDNETDTIISAVKYIQNIDPDIIYTVSGDSQIFPFLYHRALELGIEDKVNFGREKNREKQDLYPQKEAKSYFSYGRILYRPAFYMLKGRIHIDTAHSFIHNESGLQGLIDVSRCANIPLQLLSRLGPGTAISQIQMNKAMEQGYLVAWKKNRPETWKTGWHLLEADRGGMIIESAVGIHEDVIELDYASLYPSIMYEYNISPETLLCECCKDSKIKVPQLGYHICTKKQGFIPGVLKPILYRRFCFKARSKNNKYDTKFYSELQQAWKWILVVCFGYTGYRNARYGRIECHESITAFSRDILLKAIEITEESGYEVIHGIIDSLWIKQKKTGINWIKLSRMISKKTGIRIDIQGRYKWIVFLPSKQTNVGALTRYYGLLDNDELKFRGIELRQHGTPPFLKNLQLDMLKIFSNANNTQEFNKLIPETIDLMIRYCRKVIKDDVDLNDFVFTTRISKDLGSYKVDTLAKAALQELNDIDIHVEPGQSINFIVTNNQSKCYKKRVRVQEIINGNEKIDANFYINQIARCAESILIPFDYSHEKLKQIIYKNKLLN